VNLAFKKIAVYIKLLLLITVAVAVTAVLINNRNNTVSVWFFGLVDNKVEVNVVWVMLWSAIAALFAWWILKMTIGLARDLRTLSREEVLRKREEVVAARSKEVSDRQRRLDEQTRQVLADEPVDLNEKK
jgi:hypothetical protein